MPGYGQFCPIAQASEVLTERWTPLVIREIALTGSRRFNDIQRGVPLMSSSLLTKRLRQLEQAGIIERRPRADGQGTEYHLTPAGQELGSCCPRPTCASATLGSASTSPCAAIRRR